MSNDITFDENKYKIKSRSILGVSQVPGMTKFLLTKGIVKNEKQAHYFLISIAIFFLLTSVYAFTFFVFDNSYIYEPVTDEEYEDMIMFEKTQNLNFNNKNLQ